MLCHLAGLAAVAGTSNLAPKLMVRQTGSGNSESLLGSFIGFLRHPHYSAKVPIQQGAMADVLRLYSLEVSIMLPLIVIQIWVKTRLSNAGAIAPGTGTLSLNAFFWLAVILAPILEEILFRLPLRYSPLNLSLSACLWGLLITLTFAPIHSIGTINILATVVILGSILLRFWLKTSVQSQTAHRLYQGWLPILFYASALSFGLVHISNYNFTTVIGQAWTSTLLLVLTQIEGGIFLGFIRLRYGFWWAVFSHSFHNAIVLTFVVLTQLSSFDLLLKMQLQTVITQKNIFLLILLFFILDGLILCLSTVWGMVVEWQGKQ